MNEFKLYELFVENLINELEQQGKMDAFNYIFCDEISSTYPFAVAFFMFRSGQPELAAKYLSQSQIKGVNDFAFMIEEFLS